MLNVILDNAGNNIIPELGIFYGNGKATGKKLLGKKIHTYTFSKIRRQ